MKRIGEYLPPKLEVPFSRGVEIVRTSLAGLERAVMDRRLRGIGTVGRKIASTCRRHNTCSTQTLVRYPDDVLLLRFSLETQGFSFASDTATDEQAIRTATFLFDHYGQYRDAEGLLEEEGRWPSQFGLSYSEVLAESRRLELALANPNIVAQLATPKRNEAMDQAYLALLTTEC